jgi:hypothetical protein
MNKSEFLKLFGPETYQYICDNDTYDYHGIYNIIDLINTAITNNQYSEKTISKLQDAIRSIKLANCYITHVHNLVDYNHTEESFRTELIKDLQQI